MQFIPVMGFSRRTRISQKFAKAATLNSSGPLQRQCRQWGTRTLLAFLRGKLAFHSARHEAEKAFGNEQIYLEKLVLNPHHVEFQIVADSHGHVVHLGERDCSIQRRNQKVIEECPSPLMTPGLRKKMGNAAVKLAKSVGYENAGTIEFLVDQERHFYFIEMNTRIQVEHTITEEVYGCDLVKEQIRIAAGQSLSPNIVRAVPRLHAMECRINAEDPANDFQPTPGR